MVVLKIKLVFELNKLFVGFDYLKLMLSEIICFGVVYDFCVVYFVVGMYKRVVEFDVCFNYVGVKVKKVIEFC